LHRLQVRATFLEANLQLRHRYRQIITDSSHELFLNFAMSRHGAATSSFGISIDAVFASLANKDAAVCCEVPDEVGAFHCLRTLAERFRRRGGRVSRELLLLYWKSSFQTLPYWNSRLILSRR